MKRTTKQQILVDQIKDKLIKAKNNSDIESGHFQADSLLCELLDSLEYSDVTEIYYEIGKWYA